MRQNRERELQWWPRNTGLITGRPVGSTQARRCHTTLSLRRPFRAPQPVVDLVVSDADLSALAFSDAGRWLLTQQSVLLDASTDPKTRRVRLLNNALTLGAVAAMCVMFVGGIWLFTGAVFAAVLAAGAAWVGWERYQVHVQLVCAADRQATDTYGPDAARTALQTRPHLYRSALHGFVEHRSPLSIENRTRRLPAAAQ